VREHDNEAIRAEDAFGLDQTLPRDQCPNYRHRSDAVEVGLGKLHQAVQYRYQGGHQPQVYQTGVRGWLGKK
jgi:hypothetical protein